MSSGPCMTLTSSATRFTNKDAVGSNWRLGTLLVASQPRKGGRKWPILRANDGWETACHLARCTASLHPKPPGNTRQRVDGTRRGFRLVRPMEERLESDNGTCDLRPNDSSTSSEQVLLDDYNDFLAESVHYPYCIGQLHEQLGDNGRPTALKMREMLLLGATSPVAACPLSSPIPLP